jgi:hypothetical protein
MRQVAPAVRWNCYRCGRRFAHARFLAAHLLVVHNDRPEP